MGKLALYAFAAAVLLLAAVLAVLLYNTWRERRRIARMSRDHAWRVWILRVKERLDGFEDLDSDEVLARHGEWFHALWQEQKALSPYAAVEKWLVEKTNRAHA